MYAGKESMLETYIPTPTKHKHKESMIEFYKRTKPLPKYETIIIPGLFNVGGSDFNLLLDKKHEEHTTWHTDLGQENSMAYLKEKLKPEKKYIVHGVSQGGATILNALGSLPIEEQNEKIGAVVLEGTFISGNKAIVDALSLIPGFTYFPFARLLLPLLASLFLSGYTPLGRQPLDSAKKVSPTIPIIIIHAEEDYIIPEDDADSLYCTLLDRNNTESKNVYLMKLNTKRPRHVDVLDYSLNQTKEIAAINAIYKKHGLPYNKEVLEKQIQEPDLKEYQPDPKTVKEKIHNSTKWQRYLRNTIDLTTAGFIIAKFTFTYALPRLRNLAKSWVKL
jgi:hypothetical protein